MIDEQPHIEDGQDEPVRIDSIAPKVTATAMRRIPTAKEWVKLTHPYECMELQMWTGAPMRVIEGLNPQQSDETTDELRRRVIDTLGRLVLAHRFDDGTPWADDEGELPPPQDPAFWDRIPQPVFAAINAYIRSWAQNHPTLRPSTSMPRR